MNKINLENALIDSNIKDIMIDYVSIQIDIDEQKIKAAALVAQNINLKKIIGADNLLRLIDPQDEADQELLDLCIPAWCYLTYFRSLTMFQGTLTDSGYVVDAEADEKNSAKSVANEMKAIGETLLEDAVAFLNDELSDDEEIIQPITSNVRTFGGIENRASN